MDAMQRVLVPVFLRRSITAILLTGACALLAAPAFAGPLDAAHRFEKIGGGVENATAVLPVPGEMRALILQRTGEMRLVCGDGLVDRPLGTVPVRTDCGEKGLLSGAWLPGSDYRSLFVTYVAQATGFFTVGRIDFDEELRPSEVQVVWQATFPASCDNLGGGIAFHADGTVLVGTGDNGNPAGAGQITSPVGKILRFTIEGFPPSAPLEPNPFGAAPTYSMGCRNPVRLMADSETGDVWFLDLGPGDNDELNLVQRQINYGWNASMLMGFLELEGDPFHVWSPAVGPTGLNPYRGDNFKADLNVMVSASDGIISEVVPNLADNLGSVETLLFIPDPDQPQVIKDLTVLPDGMIYVIGEDGSLWRLMNSLGETHEPANASSVAPLLITRSGPDELTFATEHSAGATGYGLYTGDLMLLASQGYTHGTDQDGDGEPNETDDIRTADASAGDAWARFVAPMSGLRPDRAPESPGPDGRTGSYYLLSGDNSRLQTGVGLDSYRLARPGGNISKTCLDCGGAAEGGAEGNCRIPFELPTVIEGVGNLVPGGMNFSEDYDCKVIQLSISAEWCGPCRFLASTAEEVYQTHRDEGFTIVDVIFEDSTGAPADLATIERWAGDFGLTHPVAQDEARSVWRAYDQVGAIPQTWIISCTGMIVDHIVGADPAGIEASIEAELALGRCD